MCQLYDLAQSGEKTSLFEKGLHFVKRVMYFSRNRWYLINHLIKRRILKKEGAGSNLKAGPFKPGDRVRVKSREEIEKTLDEWQHFKGCRFMYEMRQYCGGTYKVYKKVNHFLDERKMEMLKSDQIYILEGLICEGGWPFKNCDRSCFFFWRAEWLERA
jgi:hypothetical protein